MTRNGLSWWLGGVTALAFVLVMLAGSDLPPPPGFLVVVVFGVALGASVARLLPRLLARSDAAGLLAGLPRAALIGAAIGSGIALVLAIRGPGEPSIPRPGALEAALFIAVAGLAGSLGAVALAAVAIAADRAPNRVATFLIAVIPCGIVVLLAGGMVVQRSLA